MELSTALVWALRILLPIILFCVYFKLQKGFEESSGGPTHNTYSRDKLLGHRKVVLGVPPPADKITLQDAPMNGRGGARGSRRQADASRERRDKRKIDVQAVVSENGVELSHQELEAEVDIPEQNETACKMHVESLLNYVAFNRKEQQRVFLPDTTGAPPPPPPPPAKKKADAVDLEASDEEARKANADAQLVLRGAIDLKRAEVAINLHEQLYEAEVEITAATFALLIQACIGASDLQGASDFLMKMETAGYLPGSDLLDMVMDLYNRQKAEKEHNKVGSKIANGFHSRAEEIFARVDAEGPRTKLNRTAAAFVPTFVPPPLVSAHLVEDPSEELRRTALTAAAKPFEPKFNDDSDHGMYVWTADAAEDMYCEQGGDSYPDKGKGKGKSKGKSKSKEKSKGRGKSGESWWKDQSKDSWWGDQSRDSWFEYEDDSVWRENDWDYDYYRNGDGRKNGERKYTKTSTVQDGKKSGGLVWKPKATTKEADAEVTS